MSAIALFSSIVRGTYHFVGEILTEYCQHLLLAGIGITAEQAAMVWACAAKEDNDWVKKCMVYEVEGPRPRGRPKRTWTEVVEKDCRAHELNKEDAMDRSKGSKLIKDVRWSG